MSCSGEGECRDCGNVDEVVRMRLGKQIWGDSLLHVVFVG